MMASDWFLCFNSAGKSSSCLSLRFVVVVAVVICDGGDGIGGVVFLLPFVAVFVVVLLLLPISGHNHQLHYFVAMVHAGYFVFPLTTEF